MVTNTVGRAMAMAEPISPAFCEAQYRQVLAPHQRRKRRLGSSWLTFQIRPLIGHQGKDQRFGRFLFLMGAARPNVIGRDLP